jgi:quercetin dioxygenase-like cupin family protein
MTVERNYAGVNQKLEAHRIGIDKIDPLDIGWDLRLPVGMSGDVPNVMAAYLTAEPGEIINWHTHAPTNAQMAFPIQGKQRWYFKNNSGEITTIETGPGEMVYLPGGIENKVEAIGDEPTIQLDVLPNLRHQRLDQFLGVNKDIEEGGGYAYEREEMPWGLWYDNLQDEAVVKNDDAIIGTSSVR